jgi:hypothetical protein
MWYTAKDVMVILDACQTYAYAAIKRLADEITATKIPGTEKTYARPPAGKIQKVYFCKKYMLDQKECDRLLLEAKRNGTHPREGERKAAA